MTSDAAARWEHAVAWAMRAALLGMAIYRAISGEFLLVGYCLLALGALLAPSILARNNEVNVPVELEVVLLVLLFTDMVLGKWLGLYERIVYWDKVLHLGNSVLLGFLGFLLLFLLRTTGRLRASRVTAIVLTTWLTLGLGAAWEIGEFTMDRAFGTRTQGSPTMPPLEDTMWDLILDAIGGLAGGVVAVAYLHRSARARRVSRWFELDDLRTPGPRSGK